MAGARLDNILIDASGKARRIDAGGTWFFRAKVKEEKPEAALLTLGEWRSMGFDPRGQLTQFMQAAGRFTPQESAEFLLKQGQRLAKVLDEVGGYDEWLAWINKNAPTMSPESKQKILDMIIARQYRIVRQFG